MNNAFNISDAEIIAIMNKALREAFSEEDTLTKRARRARKKREQYDAALADLLNLPECGFIPAK